MDNCIKIKRIHLHNTVFAAGKNIKDKVDLEGKDELAKNSEMYYYRDVQELHFAHKNGLKREIIIIPATNVSYMVEDDRKHSEDNPIVQQPAIAVKVEAQVETPQSHVFKGAGHGKAGRG